MGGHVFLLARLCHGREPECRREEHLRVEEVLVRRLQQLWRLQQLYLQHEEWQGRGGVRGCGDSSCGRTRAKVSGGQCHRALGTTARAQTCYGTSEAQQVARPSLPAELLRACTATAVAPTMSAGLFAGRAPLLATLSLHRILACSVGRKLVLWP